MPSILVYTKTDNIKPSCSIFYFNSNLIYSNSGLGFTITTGSGFFIITGSGLIITSIFLT